MPSLTLVQEPLFVLLFFKENKPVYLVNLIQTKNSNYNTRDADKITLFHTKHKFFKNSFFPSTVIEWNKLDPNLRSAASLKLFQKEFVKVYYIISKQCISLPQLQRNQIPYNTTPWSKSLA